MAMDQESADGVTFFAPTRKKKRPAAATDQVPSAERTSEPETSKAAKLEDAPPDEMEPFRALGLSKWQTAVCRSLGIVRPTPVQTGCIPAILQVLLLILLQAADANDLMELQDLAKARLHLGCQWRRACIR